MKSTPQVLFVCVHNAGRSQMAAAFLTHYAQGAVEVRSAGSAPADTINPAVREAMAEVGIDLAGQQPKLLATDTVEASDVVITMGCGDACPVFPGKAVPRLGPSRPRRQGCRRGPSDPRRDRSAGPGPARRADRRHPRWPDRAMTPSVLFVCVRNSGKSQMAAGLMRKAVGDQVVAYSAGTEPGEKVNALSAQALAEVGVDISSEAPKPIDPALLRAVDLVVTLGRDAKVDVPDGTRLQNWDTDEPFERGIDGIDRMRLVRDDINNRVVALANELSNWHQ